MKCEYCDSEISGGGDGGCPCCGAPLPVQKNEPVNAAQTEPPTDLSAVEERIALRVASVQAGKCRELIRQIRTDAAQCGGLLASFSRDVDIDGGDFIPSEGETVCSMLKHVTLYESRAISRSHTVKSGYSSYNYEGESERRTDYEFQLVTEGTLALTDKRFVFSGGQQVRNIKLGDIMTLKFYDKSERGGLEVSSSKRAKTMRFFGTTFDFSLRLRILRNQKLMKLIECGPEDEVVAKFVELGFFFAPAPTVRSAIHAAKSRFDSNDIVMPDDNRFDRKWRNMSAVIREKLNREVRKSDGVAIIDCTIFGSAKNGALIDGTGIYMLNASAGGGAEFDGFVDWNTFRRCGDILKSAEDVVQICASPKVGLYIGTCSLNINQALDFFKCIHKAIV